MIKVVIADDHSLFSEGVDSILSHENTIQIVKQLSDGQQLISYLEENDCDVVLLDINMPHVDGIQCAEWIVKHKPSVKIIMLTMFNKMMMVDTLVSIGVHGYVLKNVSKNDLIDAIQKVHAGKKYYSPEVTEKLIENSRQKENKTFALTKREKEVLTHISEGLKTSEIADKLFLSKHTIDTHRKNLLSKAGVKNAVDLVNWGRDNEFII